MKNKILTLIMAGVMLVSVGCKSTESSDSSSIVSDSSTVVESTVPTTTQEPTNIVEVPIVDNANTDYTMIIYNADGVTTKLVGKTSQLEFKSLCKELSEITDYQFVFDETVQGIMTNLVSIDGKKPQNGYYAVYINGYYIEDTSAFTMSTMITDDSEIVIKYTTDNILPENNLVKIPSTDCVYHISIIDMQKEDELKYYVFNNTEYTYFTETVDADLNYTATPEKNFKENKLPEAINATVNSELEVLGAQMPSSNSTAKYIVMINGCTCLSSSETITEFINSLNIE